MRVETERKYLGADFFAVRSILAEYGAITEGAHFESNTVLDTAGNDLWKEGSLLRLRRQVWPGREIFRLTFKCLPDNQESGTPLNVKMREEYELEIPDGAAMLTILRKLGYMPAAFYEKTREAWRLNLRDGSCEVDMDTLPFGEVLEIEGEPALIDEAASLLGIDKCKISLTNYHDLHQEWRRENNLSPAKDILFEQEEKKRIFARLGLSF